MDINQSCDLLQIDIKNLSKDKIKKQYHKLALKYHPDKNSDSKEAKERFQMLGEAFAIANDYNDTGSYNREKININMFDMNKQDYSFFIKSFLSTLTIKSDKIRDILFKLMNATELAPCGEDLLSHISIEDINELYMFITKYQCYFSLSTSFINKVKNMMRYSPNPNGNDDHNNNGNNSNNGIVILNPIIDDIIENNIFKLEYKNHTYFVPLWHGELYYDVSNNEAGDGMAAEEFTQPIEELIVKCIPTLPKHIWINEYNDLYFAINLELNKVFEKQNLDICVGKKVFVIPMSELKLRRYQTWIFKNEGMYDINLNNIYDDSCKRDIIVEIYINS